MQIFIPDSLLSDEELEKKLRDWGVYDDDESAHYEQPAEVL